MSNAVAIVIPTNIALPAHLQTPDIAAQIAAENAAAAGGIRTGGFPKVSIEGGKFHEVNGGETNTFMMAPAAVGQPALPMMCFEAVIIAANPALIKKYYAKKWQKGDDSAPDCQSNNGATPDVGVSAPQSSNCASCPMNAWGSKISEATGKETKACSDSKQMVVLPAWFQGWTEYKALGLAVTPAALGDWGKYVKALSDRQIPVSAVVTNITFDQTAAFPKLMFSFNRMLTADEFARVQERAKGSDVRDIIQPTAFVPAAPALPAPTAAAMEGYRQRGEAGPAAVYVPGNPAAPGQTVTGAHPTGFGASAPVAAANPVMPAYTPPSFVPPPPTAAEMEPPKRTRAKRQPAADAPAAPPSIKSAYDSLPEGSPARAALLAQFPGLVAPVATPVEPDPFSNHPPHVKIAVNAVGGLGSPAGDSMFKQLTGATNAAAPQVNPHAPAAAPAVTPPAQPASPVAAAPAPAFSAPAPAPAAPAPTAAAVSSGASLKDILQKKLGIAPSSTTVQ